MEKLKVVWICNISNSDIRIHLKLRNPDLYWKNILKKIFNRRNHLFQYSDYSVWNTLAVREFEKNEKIELHVISLQVGMKKRRQDFQMRGIYYHCIQPQCELWIVRKNRMYLPVFQRFKRNRALIREAIEEIQPDIINLIGAEIPEFSMAALDIDSDKIPFIVSLQTVMSDPDFLQNYPISLDDYYARSSVEKEVFRSCKYIASDVSYYRQLVRFWNPNVQFVKFHFCNEMNIGVYCNDQVKKEYDFVYYAYEIEKAAEDAVWAFYEAFKQNNKLTLNIIGGYQIEFYNRLKAQITDWGIQNNIYFSGRQKTHQDVMRQILKSKYALLPIKVDIVSTTIREAISLGLPIVTTITKGTPYMNKEKLTLLLSEIGDHKAMAANMIRLVNNPSLGDMLIENSRELADKIWNNSLEMRRLADIYHAVYENFHNGTPIPTELKLATF